MWKGPGQDPGGGPDSGPPSNNPPVSSQELSDLKDQFEQQELLIAQLKELIRKSEQTNVTQEKVDEYMNTLSKVNARAKKGKRKDGGVQITMDTPAKEKINLLRQQLEENKMKLAERGKNQKGIEDMVSQLKAQLDDSQQLISQSPLNLSLQETKIDYSPNSTSEELYSILLTKERKVTELTAKVQKLENNVLDLQENLKEKDSVIDARTKAITLMTENLSKKGKNTLDTLDETRDQMRKMQENFVSLELEMKARQMKLLDDLRLKNYEIAELQELNSALEQEKNELNTVIIQLKETSPSEEVDSLREKIDELTSESTLKNSDNALEYEKKLSILQQEFDSLKLENRKLAETLSHSEDTIVKLSEQIKAGEVDEELSKLKKQLEESNKNMIKVKAQHKSKVKELVKKVEAFKKVSDVNAELVKIEAENCRLNQKIAELEEEKGALQLKMVESDPGKGEDSCREIELEEKDKIISILESDIVSLKSENISLTEKLSTFSPLQAQVTSEMNSIQFEEQLDALEKEKSHLLEEKDNLLRVKVELSEEIESLRREKSELSQKLDSYIQENMELIDKLEKLSTEKVSSAESIEIVEGLTQQEKIELEAYQKSLDITQGSRKLSEEVLPQQDLNESVNELTEETSELLQKIELFTVERREVMEKMEQLKSENSQLSLKIEEIENNRDILAETYEQLQNEKENLDSKFDSIQKENETLKKQLNEESKSKKELEDAREQISELQNKLSVQIIENAELNNNVVDLNRTLFGLQEYVKKLEDEKQELCQLLEKTKEELEIASNSEWESQKLVESRGNEISKLIKERDNIESTIENLQQIIKEKDHKFKDLSSKLQEKYKTLQNQLENNTSNFESLKAPLEAKIDELTGKNKEQLEKMKKIAANLKKKNQAYQELEDKFNESKEKWETESREKDSKVETLIQQLQDLENEVSRLRESNVELENLMVDLRVKAEKASELSLQQELLQTQGDFSTKVDKESSLQNRIQELEMIVEERDSSLVYYKERVEVLEESLISLEELRVNLEKRAMDLESQLEEKSKNYEELSSSADVLEKMISDLKIRNEEIELKLGEATLKNEDLSEEVRGLFENNHKLENEIHSLQHDNAEDAKFKVEIEELETKIASLTQINSNLESNLKDLGEKYEKTIGEAKEEADMFSDQLRHLEGQLEESKSKLAQHCEEIADYDLRLKEANDELDDLRRLLDDKSSEIESLKVRNQSEHQGERNDLSSFFDFPSQSSHPEAAMELREKLDEAKMETNRLGQELSESSSKFFDEISNLKRVLDQKNVEIDGLKHSKNASSFFDLPPQSQVQTEVDNDELRKDLENAQMQIDKLALELKEASSRAEDEIVNLQRVLGEKNAEIDELKRQVIPQPNNLSSFFDLPQQLQVPQQLDDLQRKIGEFKVEVARLNQAIKESEVRSSQEISNLKQVLENKNSEIEDLKNQVPKQKQPGNLSSFFDSPQQSGEVEFFEKQEVSKVEVRHQQSENTQGELLNKIKTLEFMLYSVEKEKDDALLQCHEMSNELTRLVYERENVNSGLESQILSDEAMADTPDSRKDLQKMEYEETNPPLSSVEALGPVMEPQVTTKEAYLCFPSPNKQVEGAEANIDSQVISIADTLDSNDSRNRKELRDVEFEKTKPPVTSSEQPIDEELAKAKSAYLCYESGGSFDTFGENDDGWGWGPEEAKSEEEHIDNKKTESVNFASQLEVLGNKVRVLEMERENHLEEIKQLQIKSGKLIKKLKEFKVKNEQLIQQASAKKVEGDFFNLDETIQEELKLEINHVEKRLKETLAELEREKSEKVSVQKRVDVLTSANERLVEMKEKQDVDLLGWQQNCRELNAKLERFEWGDDGFGESSQAKTPTDSPNKSQVGDLSQLERKINELNETIKELTLDNEELQTLLEEQRTLRITAEKSRSVEPIPENMKTDAEFKAIVDERDALNESLRLGAEDKKKLQSEINELIKKNDDLGRDFNDVLRKHQELSSAISEKDQIIERLDSTLHHAEEEKARITSSVVEESKVLSEISQEKDTLFKELQEKNALIDSIRDSYNSEVNLLKSELEAQQKSAQALLETNTRLVEEISLKDTKIGEISSELQRKISENVITIEELGREWEGRVDQRGNDVAESWKLHLESRENEFAQMENALRKELNELEEKCNALVNENNELRRNVDAEIRNEVDRVSALQQQINDRQQSIVELGRSLQEKQEMLDSLQTEVVRLNSELAKLRQEIEIRDGNLELLETQLESEKGIVEGVIKKIEELGILIPARDANSILGALEDQLKLFIENQQEISKLKHQIAQNDEIERSLEEIRRSVFEKDQLIASQSQQLQQIQNLHDYENENTQNLQQNILEYQQSNALITSQLEEKSSRLEQALIECQNIHLSAQTKDAEINNLKMLLENKDRESQTFANEQWQEVENSRRRLVESENRYEELLSTKDGELTLIRTQMEEITTKTNQFEEVHSQFVTKSEECAELQRKLDEQNVLIDDENKQLTDLRKIIEEQVLKIEDLKKELFQKSNDFDSLIAEMDISRTHRDDHQLQETVRPTLQPKFEDDDLSEPVNRAELDLALYMLHQRDVRCEELTVELTQLLEERDTLQLRLSNAIREKEEFVRKIKAEGVVNAGQDISESSVAPFTATGTIPKNSPSTSSMGVTEESDSLSSKLSELKSVGYKKDKTIVDEQELRRFQALSIMHQHRDDASRLPPEAAARLVDASYTLSRDVQSPSKVLLNWLWGRSTPKVNDI